MAFAADQDFRRIDQRAGGGRQPVQPVLADADDVQPGRSFRARCQRVHRRRRDGAAAARPGRVT